MLSLNLVFINEYSGRLGTSHKDSMAIQLPGYRELGGAHSFFSLVSFWFWDYISSVDEYTLETVIFFFINSVFCRIVRFSYFTNHYLLLFGRNSTLSLSKELFEFFKSSNVSMINLLEILNIKIPRFCFHDDLSIAGNCRMCLVEVKSSLKPVIACATSAINGLLIHSNSSFVFRIRESILEFLLINHPLDCPICDEAGECDLQDQTYVFGSDQSRYKFDKRSVSEEKYFHPLIRTVMTRCIHCTRCIRFSDEVLGLNSLGMMGRGSLSEVDNYNDIVSNDPNVQFMLDSPFVGNLVDLCPVGALTSSTKSFSYRSWEFESFDSLDLLDSSTPPVRVDIRSNTVVRVLPRLNDLTKEFISDNIRHIGGSMYVNRVLSPLVHMDEDYVDTSWKFVFNFLTDIVLFQENAKDLTELIGLNLNMLLYIGDTVGLYTLFSYFLFGNKNNVNIMSRDTKPNLSDLRDFYNNRNASHFADSSSMSNSLYYFNGVNFLIESRYIGLKFFLNRENFNANGNRPVYIGPNIRTYDNSYIHAGITNYSSSSIIYGKSFFSFIKKQFSRLMTREQMPILWDIGEFVKTNLYRRGNSDIWNALNSLYDITSSGGSSSGNVFFITNSTAYSYYENHMHIYSAIYNNYHNNSRFYYFNLNSSVSHYAVAELGLDTKDFYLNSNNINRISYINFFMNWNNDKRDAGAWDGGIDIFLGSYIDYTTNYSLILPISMFFENTELYVNNNSSIVSASKIIDTTEGVISCFSFFYNYFFHIHKRFVAFYLDESKDNFASIPSSEYSFNLFQSYYDYLFHFNSSNKSFFNTLESCFAIDSYRENTVLENSITSDIVDLDRIPLSYSPYLDNYVITYMNRDLWSYPDTVTYSDVSYLIDFLKHGMGVNEGLFDLPEDKVFGDYSTHIPALHL